MLRFLLVLDFNPRSPRGERRNSVTVGKSIESFQSTFPARGTTKATDAAQQEQLISIHVPREGNDPETA
ncbi:protein of unknown function [Ruminococcaceae bacterium BL-6]|nr:protein of unknown function [Ruminococcaceae bacterium BL-6]